MKLQNKRKFYTFLLIVITLIILGVYGLTTHSEQEQQWQEYYIQDDDTLWSVVSSHYDGTVRIDETIYKIEQKNGIDANIHQGEMILIPTNNLREDK